MFGFDGLTNELMTIQYKSTSFILIFSQNQRKNWGKCILFYFSKTVSCFRRSDNDGINTFYSRFFVLKTPFYKKRSLFVGRTLFCRFLKKTKSCADFEK